MRPAGLLVNQQHLQLITIAVTCYDYYTGGTCIYVIALCCCYLLQDIYLYQKYVVEVVVFPSFLKNIIHNNITNVTQRCTQHVLKGNLSQMQQNFSPRRLSHRNIEAGQSLSIGVRQQGSICLDRGRPGSKLVMHHSSIS